MKLYIVTAEPSNFVPEKLKEAAEAGGHEAHIINILRTTLTEQTSDGEEASHVCYYPEPKKAEEGETPAEVKPVKIEAPCVIIPRLNEHNLEYKLGVFGRLADNGCVMLNTMASMALCNDKLQSQAVLNTAGLRTPYTMNVGSVEMLEPALKHMEEQGRLKFPMIIKTLRGTHGIGVMKVDSRSSLVSVAQVLMMQGEVMLQEFIEHKESARLIMIGEEMLAANLRKQPKEKEEFRTNSHLGSVTEKHEPSEEELEMGRTIVNLFGCRFCAIDYIIQEKDGKREILVLEVNGSPGLEAIQKDWKGERDLPKLVVEYCDRLSSGEVPAPEETPSAERGEHVATKDEQPAKGEEPLSDIEELKILRLDEKPLVARVDTGAKYCSLHAEDVKEEDNWVKFKRNDVVYKVQLDRGIKIRNAVGKHRRLVVKLDVELRGKRYNGVEFTITTRTDMKYEALIGRNLLELIGLPVFVHAQPGTDKVTDTSLDQKEEE